jgi:formamidopyrimidine-DNA glycosylase
MMPEGPEVRTLVDQLQPGVGLRLCDLQFVSGRYTKHGKPKGFDDFKKTMTYYKSERSKSCSSGGSGGTRIDHITSWNAKGKFIWLTLDNGIKDEEVHDDEDDDNNDYLRSIWITLGMSGRFVSNAFSQQDNDDGSAHNQPRWYFEFLDSTITSTTTLLEEEQQQPEPALKRIYYYDTRNFGTLRFSLSKKELEDKLKSLGPDILDDDITEESFLEIMTSQRQSMNICKLLMNQSVSSRSNPFYSANMNLFY